MEDYRDEEESGHLCTPHHNAALHKSSDWGGKDGLYSQIGAVLVSREVHH